MTALTLEERRHFVGASEIAALLDVSPYVSRFTLWHIKAGNIDPDDLDGSERVQAGQFLEPGIAAWANHKWAWDLSKSVGYTPHPRVAGMGASLDFVSQATGEPVDCKNVDGLVFRDEWSAEGDRVLDAPIHLQIQIQAQLACTGAARGWLLALVGGNRLLRYEVQRHDALIARLEAEVEAFWQSIRDGREPMPDYGRDASTFAKLYPKGTGGEVFMTEDNRLPVLCSEYLAAHRDAKAADEAKERAVAEIKSITGEASKVYAKGFTVSVADIAGGTFTTERKPYRRFTIKENRL